MNIFVLASKIGIKKNLFNNVVADLQSLQGKETTGRADGLHFMWLPCCNLVDVQSVEEMFALWRWPADFDEVGNIVALEFSGEKLGDEELFFTTISPYVCEGSEVVVLSEDYKVWRWFFDGRTCEKQYGHFVFE